ncbi:MAG: hypothetical protein JWQ81_3083 [Amycolatopsis sp.]|nr:hypothetical protein [Amycolatopsis sp.]
MKPAQSPGPQELASEKFIAKAIPTHSKRTATLPKVTFGNLDFISIP